MTASASSLVSISSCTVPLKGRRKEDATKGGLAFTFSTFTISVNLRAGRKGGNEEKKGGREKCRSFNLLLPTANKKRGEKGKERKEREKHTVGGKRCSFFAAVTSNLSTKTTPSPASRGEKGEGGLLKGKGGGRGGDKNQPGCILQATPLLLCTTARLRKKGGGMGSRKRRKEKQPSDYAPFAQRHRIGQRKEKKRKFSKKRKRRESAHGAVSTINS